MRVSSWRESTNHRFIASALVTVARITLAPPSFCNSAAGSWAAGIEIMRGA